MQKMEKRNRLWPGLSRCWAILLRWIDPSLRHKKPVSKQVMRVPLRIVFYKEGDDWIAHCLEFNLLGDGSTQQEAIDQLCESIVLQIQATIEHKNPANLFTPADGKIFEMFAAGDNVATGELQFKKMPEPRRFDSYEIEDCQYREYVGGATCGV